MQKFLEPLITHRNQFLVYLGISLGIFLLTTLLQRRNADLFKAFFGDLNPLFAVIVFVLLGVLLFLVLLPGYRLGVYSGKTYRGLLTAAGLALFSGMVIILLDFMVVLPPNINRPYPDSLLFYPIFGFVVEVLFHLLPLALILFSASSISSSLTAGRTYLVIILIISLLEPTFQSVLGFSRAYPLWVMVYVFLHILVLNVFQLLLFTRYDFVSMYGYRLVFYFIWHIAWGQIRLNILF